MNEHGSGSGAVFTLQDTCNEGLIVPSPGLTLAAKSPEEWPWFCLFTKQLQESFAKMQLQRQGVEVFLPLLKSKRPRRGQVHWAVGPMFPRYVFVRPTDFDVLPRIRSTLGVVKVVSFGGKAAPVPLEVIQAIQARCGEANVVELEERDYTHGDRVKIIGGPYQGMSALFDRQTSQTQRVAILLEMMSTVAQVIVERKFLEPDEEA